ncbi:putative repeat protein (TIGR02543 family) [Microbacterium natoriense]|uniref:Repeat protein (TIGR02543 family) n=1 Tax=Microbacterium natoriense TaxID=284570 RepID=A0AAW8EUS3_9MICO|nr:putative Ig domain-containing protein [Microbacterium natoriense]MDQ0646595.1 putative repeat protein (TIGR02543 family) [Microbacterium natoriense]
MRNFKFSAPASAATITFAVLLSVAAAAPAHAVTTAVTDWTTLDQSFENAVDGDVVMLDADIDASGTADYLGVPAGAGITLDLNGHSLKLAPTTGPGIHVGSTSSLTIDDSVGTGRLEAIGSANPADPWPYFPGIGTDTTDLAAGAVTINGGAITAQGGMYAAGIGGSRFAGGGSVTMTGGSLVAQSGSLAASVGSGYLVFNPLYRGSVTVVGPEDATGLPTVAGRGGPDNEVAPVSYTDPTSGVLVTGDATGSIPDQGRLTLAFHYRVTFAFADGVTSDSTQIVDWGHAASVPADPVRPGYTFAGWASSVAGTSPGDPTIAPVTFTAQWNSVALDAPEITTLSLPDGIVTDAYSAPVNAIGTGPITFQVSAGTLPAGLVLDPATGVVSGTPTTAGTFAFTVSASNAGGSDEQEYTVVIRERPIITTMSLPDGTIAAPYRETIAATGTGPITFAVTAGSLPPGLSLDPTTGVISGTPTVNGSFPFTVTASNAVGDDTHEYTIAIAARSVPATSTDSTGTSVRTPSDGNLAWTGAETPLPWMIGGGLLILLGASTILWARLRRRFA